MPFLTIVKLAHSSQETPSYPFIRASFIRSFLSRVCSTSSLICTVSTTELASLKFSLFRLTLDAVAVSMSFVPVSWRSADGSQNRYWLIENINNAAFKNFRECLYKYHREGLDVMQGNKKQGEYAIYKSLIALEEVHKRQPSSYLLQVYFNAKSDEVVNIFQNATDQQKEKLVPVLIKIDPGNTKKYNKILKGN